MRVSLRYKWIVLVVSFILFTSVATYLVSIRMGTITIRKELLERGLAIAEGLAYNCEYGLFTKNIDVLYNLVMGVSKMPDFAYCGIYDENGTRLTGIGSIKKGLSRVSKTQYLELELEEAGYFDIVVPVFTKVADIKEAEAGLFISEEEWIREAKRPEKEAVSGEELAIFEEPEVARKIIGFVQVGISDIRALEAINKLKANIIGISGVVILFSVLITVFFVNRLIKPLYLLSLATQRVAGGDLLYRTMISRKDELGILADSFNKMADNLGKSRDELITARDYTDNIIKSMIDTLIVVDPEGRIKTINKATSALLGYKEDELIGKPVATIFEEEVTPFKGTRMKKLIEEGSIRDYGMTYKTKTGERIPVSFSGSVMRDKDGELIGIVGIARDMREIKRLMQKEKELAVVAAAAAAEKKRAEELDALNQQLRASEQQLKAANQQLRASEQQLRASNQQLGAKEQALRASQEDLRKKMVDLERFNRLMVGRELEMVKLKEEVNSLFEKLGQPKKYEAPEKIQRKEEVI